MTRYYDTYEAWRRDPEAFWADAAQRIHWYRPWKRVFDDSRAPFCSWFAGGEVNTCYNAIDRHVDAGRGEQPALPILPQNYAARRARYHRTGCRDEVSESPI